MHVIPRSDGPYTLFDRHGNVCIYSTKTRAVKALGGYQRLCLQLERDRPGSVQQWLEQPSVCSLLTFPTWMRTQFLLLNTVGLPLAPEDFAEFAPRQRTRVQGSYGVQYQGSKCRGGDGYRRMRTAAELRLNALVVFEDDEVPARPCRRGRNLPHSWDLVGCSFERNWKRNRKTQYRSG